MTLVEAFDSLKNIYGNHSAAARALKINTSYYRDIRNGRVRIPPRTAQYILLKAREISPSTAPMPKADA